MQKIHKFKEIWRHEGPRKAANRAYMYLNSELSKLAGRVIDIYTRIYYKHKYGESAPSPYQLVYVDPNNIDHMLIPRFPKSSYRKSVICPGNWDVVFSDQPSHKLRFHPDNDSMSPRLVSIENFTLYQSFKQHFINNVPWENTKIYNVFLNNNQSSRYTSRNAIHQRLNEVDDLFDYIKENGYMTQRELLHKADAPFSHSTKNNSFPPEHHEVCIHIGRNGRLIFCTGQHRFSIARILDIDRIPVRVHMRHTNWQSIRHKVYNGECTDSSILQHPDIKSLLKGCQ